MTEQNQKSKQLFSTGGSDRLITACNNLSRSDLWSDELTVNPELMVMCYWTLARMSEDITSLEGDPGHLSRMAMFTSNKQYDEALRELYDFQNNSPIESSWLWTEAEFVIAPYAPVLFISVLPHMMYSTIDGTILAYALSNQDRDRCNEYLVQLRDFSEKDKYSPRYIAATGEAILAARDRNDPWEELEHIWSNWRSDSLPSYKEITFAERDLRLTSRIDPFEACRQLRNTERLLGWSELPDAQIAVSGRLARTDRMAAYEFVTETENPIHQAMRLEGVLWDGQLDMEGLEILEQLSGQQTFTKLGSTLRCLLVQKVLYLYTLTGQLDKILELIETSAPPAWVVVRSAAPALRRMQCTRADKTMEICSEVMDLLVSKALPKSNVMWQSLSQNDDLVGVTGKSNQYADALFVESLFDPAGPWWSPCGNKLP